MKISNANINIEITEPITEQDINDVKNILDYLFSLKQPKSQIPESNPLIQEYRIKNNGRDLINIDNKIEFLTDNELIKLYIHNEPNNICLKIEDLENLSKISEEEQIIILKSLIYSKRRVLQNALKLWYKIKSQIKKEQVNKQEEIPSSIIEDKLKEINHGSYKTRKEKVTDMLSQGKTKEEISKEMNLNLNIVENIINILNKRENNNIPYKNPEKKIEAKIHLGL